MRRPQRGPISWSGGGAGCGFGGCGRRPEGRSVFREDPGKIRAVAGTLMLKYYELSELLERLQSSGGYGTSDWVHTFGVAQDQKQPCFPNS
ncbi:unnamed protein product [Rangifer tarandus platyrhynchus]|uniref:Uncharacterized protein n=1 Tax=Rangifer tarandus platyrhynchus TaxID=3082113 RepID=A0ABN8XYK8_RANTA|nr:unnamed protein product [Rangifer tarandus platyrhynchus]